MSSSYSLRITSDTAQVEYINSVLSISPTSVDSAWEYSIDDTSDLYSSAVSFISKLLTGKMEFLEDIGITRDDISIWFLYEYEGECNMEFNPEDLKKVGDLGISLCISCWEKNSTITLDDIS